LGNPNFPTFGKQIIPTLDLKFDLVFIDADKENYLNYFELIIPKNESRESYYLTMYFGVERF
jgi:hypothetical protein